MGRFGDVFFAQTPSVRGSLRDGDVVRFSLGEGAIYGKVTCRSVMYGFAAMMDVYREVGNANASVADIAKFLNPAHRLMGPLLIDADIIRSGFGAKVGKVKVSDKDLTTSIFLSPEADGDHPLAAYFDAMHGTYRLYDRSRESDFLVAWTGERWTEGSSEHLGLWGLVPDSHSLADQLAQTLRAQGVLPD